jgi:chromatin remodeling complex protein RSC6
MNLSWIKKQDKVYGNFAEFVGAKFISREEAIIKVWNYIKEKNLQRENEQIFCDEKLLNLLQPKTNPIPNFFTLNSLSKFNTKKKFVKIFNKLFFSFLDFVNLEFKNQ